MGCACSKAVAATTQEEIDRLTSKKARRQRKAKKHALSEGKRSQDAYKIAAQSTDSVHEARSAHAT